ncbi:MAG: hypothetical protein ACI311_06510 [Bacilli bacterium]
MKVLLIDETINIKDYLITTNSDPDIEFVEIKENDSEYQINDIFSSVDAIIYISILKEKYYRNDDSMFNLFLNKYVESLNKALIIYVGPSSQRLGTSEFSKSCRNREIQLTNMASLFSSNIHLFRATNIFGRWCDDRQCDYIMDICNKVVNDIPVEIGEEKAVEFNYIEDVKNELIEIVKGHISKKSISSQKFANAYFLTNKNIYDLFLILKQYNDTRDVPIVFDKLLTELINIYNQCIFEKQEILKMNSIDKDGQHYLVYSSRFGGKKFLYKFKINEEITNEYSNHPKRLMFITGKFVVKIEDLRTKKVYNYNIDETFKELCVPSEVKIIIKCMSDEGILLKWVIPYEYDESKDS